MSTIDMDAVDVLRLVVRGLEINKIENTLFIVRDWLKKYDDHLAEEAMKDEG